MSLPQNMFYQTEADEIEPMKVTMISEENSLLSTVHVQAELIQQEAQAQSIQHVIDVVPISDNDKVFAQSGCPKQDTQSINEDLDIPFTFCYKCGMCNDADFESLEDLKDHLQTEHFQNDMTLNERNMAGSGPKLKRVIILSGTESFQCGLCNVHFAQSDLAQKHMDYHAQNQCQACEEYFVDSDMLQNHRKVCRMNKFICSVCGKSYAKQTNLIRHKKTHVFKNCTYCTKMFLIDADLEKHLATHEDRNNLDENGRILNKDTIDTISSPQTSATVDILEKEQPSSFSQNISASGSESMFEEDSGESYKVDIPELSDDDFSDLISFEDQGLVGKDSKHKKDEKIENKGDASDVGQEKFKCNFCDKLFKGNRELKNHVRVHMKLYKCDLCEKTFQTLEELEQHEDIHGNDDPLKCNVCGRRFRLQRHLKQHVKIHVKEFRCDDCDEKFQSFVELREHRRTHSTLAPFKCDICDQRFTLRKYLQKHNSVHTGEKPHQCKTCNKCFRLASSLRHHERVHSGELPFKCDICDKNFRLSQALKKHIVTHHTAEKPYVCDICGKGFVEKGRLTAHRSRIHFGKKKQNGNSEQRKEVYPCLLCQEGFHERSVLDEHLKTSHAKEKDGSKQTAEQTEKAEEDKLFVCVKCGKGFSTCEKLLGHMRRHGEPAWLNKSGACRSTCHICNKTVNYLQKHLVTHTGAKPFICEICDKGFPERYILTKHMKTHSTVRQYECKLCNSAFKRGDNLKRHLRITHSVDPEKYNINDITSTKNKTYVCKRCDIVFTEESEFHQHKRSHGEKVPAVCSMCGKLFTNTAHLKSHMKIHANWRPYMCETCGKTFTENSQLKKHIRIHTGEKPYTCQVCYKSFSQSCSLNNHMKSHQFAGETPFKCSLCDAAFTYCGELERHKKGHMGRDVFGCGMCSQKFSHPDDLKGHVDEHLGKTTAVTDRSQIITESTEEQNLPVTVFGGNDPADLSVADVNISYQTEACVSYPVVTVPYSTPVEPVGTLPYNQPSLGHGSMESFPGPGLEQPLPLHNNTMPQTINMYHVQTLVHEAEMLIQNANQNQ